MTIVKSVLMLDVAFSSERGEKQVKLTKLQGIDSLIGNGGELNVATSRYGYIK